MNHLVEIKGNGSDSKSSLISRILLDIKDSGVTVTDSDMFIYCDFYTGCFWTKDIKKAA